MYDCTYKVYLFYRYIILDRLRNSLFCINAGKWKVSRKNRESYFYLIFYLKHLETDNTRAAETKGI